MGIKDQRRPSRKRRGRVVTASDAAKTFGRLVERVREEGVAYIVERAGVPVVQIAPIDNRRATLADLADLLRTSPRLDDAYLRDVEHGIAMLNQPSVPANRWES